MWWVEGGVDVRTHTVSLEVAVGDGGCDSEAAWDVSEAMEELEELEEEGWQRLSRRGEVKAAGTRVVVAERSVLNAGADEFRRCSSLRRGGERQGAEVGQDSLLERRRDAEGIVEESIDGGVECEMEATG